MNSLVEAVNALLLQGEPENITKPDTNGYVGYEPQAIIDAMNEVYGIGEWGFEEISSETMDNEKGTLAIAQIAVWLKGIEFKPFSWGQSRVTRGDTGDARKGAQTDAIKKGLAYFSIGNRAYHGLLGKPKPSQAATSQPAMASEKQIVSINKLCEYLGKPALSKALSYEQAKAMLDQLTLEYRQMREAQKAATKPATASNSEASNRSATNGKAQPVPSGQASGANKPQPATMERLIAKAKERTKALGYGWTVVKLNNDAEGVSDADLTLQHIGKINGWLTAKEKEQGAA